MAAVNVFCEQCGLSLGQYSAAWDADGRGRETVWLSPTQLPRGFAELTWISSDRGRQLPKRYFMRQAGAFDRTMAAPRSYPKTRWRCGCGHNPTYRDDTLGAMLIHQGGSTLLV